MVGVVYGVQVYTGRTAVADAKTFIEALGAEGHVQTIAWSEAETPTIMIIYNAGGF